MQTHQITILVLDNDEVPRSDETAAADIVIRQQTQPPTTVVLKNKFGTTGAITPFSFQSDMEESARRVADTIDIMIEHGIRGDGSRNNDLRVELYEGLSNMAKKIKGRP